MNIKDKDKQRLLDFYNASIQSKVFDWNKVGWNSRESQQNRFHQITKKFDIQYSSVLDYGCGVGDLYEFLNNRYPSFKYLGVDVNQNMISIARNKHAAEFQHFNDINDLYDNEIEADYILASGVFSFKIEDYKNIYKSEIKELYEFCKNGLSFNMLKTGIHQDDEIYATWSVFEVSEFVKSFASKFEIVDKYGDFSDFTVIIHK